MAPCSIALLALGALPRPSISAEPGSEIPRGRPVTIVCRGPAGFEEFRLEKEGSSQFWGEKNLSTFEREARFLFPSMGEDTAGRYYCRYIKSTLWSALSDDLRLVLSKEDVTQAPTSGPAQPSAAPALLLTTEHLYLLIGVPLALLLCLLLLLLFCLHRQHQRKPGWAWLWTAWRGHQTWPRLIDPLRRTGRLATLPLLQEIPRR